MFSEVFDCLSRAMSDVEHVLVSNFIFILKPHTKLEKHLLRLQHSEYRKIKLIYNLFCSVLMPF